MIRICFELSIIGFKKEDKNVKSKREKNTVPTDTEITTESLNAFEEWSLKNKNSANQRT